MGQPDMEIETSEVPAFPGAPAPAARPTVAHPRRTVRRNSRASPLDSSSVPTSPWFASHHQNADGTNALYSYSYLFAY